VIYSQDDGNNYLMRSDGSEPHKIASMEFRSQFAWSPDGARFRFSKDTKLWEMSSSFTNPYQLLPGWRTITPNAAEAGRRMADFFLPLGARSSDLGSR